MVRKTNASCCTFIKAFNRLIVLISWRVSAIFSMDRLKHEHRPLRCWRALTGHSHLYFDGLHSIHLPILFVGFCQLMEIIAVCSSKLTKWKFKCQQSPPRGTIIKVYLRNHCASRISTYYVNLDLSGKWVEDKRVNLKVIRALLFHRYHLYACLWGLWVMPKKKSQRYKVTIEKFWEICGSD